MDSADYCFVAKLSPPTRPSPGSAGYRTSRRGDDAVDSDVSRYEEATTAFAAVSRHLLTLEALRLLGAKR